jgi:predicted transcriptional regulator
VRLVEEPPRFVGRIKNEEVDRMSDQSQIPPLAGSGSPMRALAVRITDGLRAQLDVIAQLNDRSVTEEIRIALEDWIGRSKSDPNVLKRAETVRAEIEREALTKRNAIEAIFATETPAKSAPPRRDTAKEQKPGS